MLSRLMQRILLKMQRRGRTKINGARPSLGTSDGENVMNEDVGEEGAQGIDMISPNVQCEIQGRHR